MGTSMIVNRQHKEEQGGADNALPKLVEKKIDVKLDPKEVKYIPIDLGISKYELRTLTIENSENNEYECSIYDKQQNGQIQYRSIREKRTYDIINVPCYDKDMSGVCHMYVENFSNVPSMFTVILKVTTLL